MKTIFMLMAQYDGLAVIPVEDVCRDYFRHLSAPKFMAKVMAGEIDIPVMHMEGSRKTSKGIHISDLADYLDACRAAALRERRQITGYDKSTTFRE